MVAQLRVIFLVFLDPCHLNGFEFAFGGFCGIIAEIVEFGDPSVQVGIADVNRVDLGMPFIERECDVFGMIPGESRHELLF